MIKKKKARYFYHVKWPIFFLLINFDTQAGEGRLTAHDSLP